MKPGDFDTHTFHVNQFMGFMSIRCLECRWVYTYTLGDEATFQKAKNAAAEHRKGAAGESETERYRR